MSMTVVYRIAAAALLVGGLVGVVAGLVQPTGMNKATVASSLYYPSQVGLLAAGLLTVGSFAAGFARQWHRVGWLGLAGLVLVLAGGMILGIGTAFTGLFVEPWVVNLSGVSASALNQGTGALPVVIPVMSITLAIGGILFGIATLRARVLSPWVGPGFIVLVVLSTVAGALNLPGILGNLSVALIYGGLAWFGIGLWMSLAAEANGLPEAGSASRQGSGT